MTTPIPIRIKRVKYLKINNVNDGKFPPEKRARAMPALFTVISQSSGAAKMI